MSNPIRSRTGAFLDEMRAEAPEAVERAAASARSHSKTIYGVELSLEEEAHLAIAVKFIAAADGLSPVEAHGLRRLMQRYEPPEAFIEFVERFDLDGVGFEHVADLFEPGSAKARRVLSGAIFVACIDGGDEGLSEAERAAATRIADQMKLERALVDVYEARSRLDLLAFMRGDIELLEVAARLRHALWAL